ncbi:hypothetical protein [Pseudopedobacter beijingensis]|uniref:4-O-methyl-glucuronoyl methylesterase-like domain-containing protein n=1 Tax=Pseudopedobacter beijingensis TaxID=1207056 RepID=A0ABW4IBB0_9SPHI
MKTPGAILLFLLGITKFYNLQAQIPLVYGMENTGRDCLFPSLRLLDELPVQKYLPDPFIKSDGSGRVVSFEDWECRRNEIKKQIEYYEIGVKPEKTENIIANFSGDTLTVNVTVDGRTLILQVQVLLPAGKGPFPAVIGMNRPSGSLPDSLFTQRNIARIVYHHDQVTSYKNPQSTDAFYQLYPEYNLDNSGQYCAWAWGISRIIDGLELVKADLPVDLNHLAVSGCSYAGKMALFAGAFDERIALTIAQESGGGGAPSWRVSETDGKVEKIGATNYQWFKNDMIQFAGDNVSKLPHDHHELMGMIVPRALLITGNTDYEWLSNFSCYVSAKGVQKIYNAFGIGDRFGFYIDGGYRHCVIPDAQVPILGAFLDKFLLGNLFVNTDSVEVFPLGFEEKFAQWIHW